MEEKRGGRGFSGIGLMVDFDAVECKGGDSDYLECIELVHIAMMRLIARVMEMAMWLWLWLWMWR